MITGIIDIGSNSVRFSVYRIENEHIILLMNKKHTAGLAGCVENGNLTQDGICRAIAAISEFQEIAEAFGVEIVFAFATASLRNVANSEAVLREIQAATGQKVEIISGEEEARLDFIGATHFLKLEEGLLVDIGGGSTELVHFTGRKIKNLTSLPIGSFNLYVRHVHDVFPDKEERRSIKQEIREEFEKVCWLSKQEIPLLCGVGGTVRAFKKLCGELFAPGEALESLEVSYLDQLHRLLKQENPDIRQKFYKVVPERILNIQPGLMILRETAKRFHCQKIAVSPYGVREGYLIERVLSK